MKFATAVDIVIDFIICGARCSVEDEDVIYSASEILSENCEKSMVEETAVLKSVFLEANVESCNDVAGHTHGKSAATRSTASLLIDCVSQSVGRQAVFYQGSRADTRKGRLISRSTYWAKDAMCPIAPPVKEPELVAMIDVDYYVDMEKKLLRDFSPHLLYTFQPTSACKDAGEYKYTFDDEGRVSYQVSGGGCYKHHVWNWDGDSCMVLKKGVFGFTKSVATYAIERRRMDDDHQVVLLAPLNRYKGYLISVLAEKFAKARPLDRLRVVEDGFIRMTVNDEKGLFRCTGRVGGYTQSRVPARVDDAIASTYVNTKGGLTLASVKSKMEDNDPSSNKVHVGAEVLLEYHLRDLTFHGTTVSSLKESVRRYQYVPKNKEADFDAKAAMTAFMQPIVNGGFVPDSCYGNDARAAEERVNKLKIPDMGISNFMLVCMDEFIDKIFDGRRHFLEPLENEVVYARQNRPAQIRILDNAQNESPNFTAKNFVKKEAYPNVNDPRIISQINGSDKMHYSAYIYALTDNMKGLPWYAFGKSPKEIAERVADICVGSNWVDLTDFSRMDGRVGNVARAFERRLMNVAFKTTYSVRMNELMRKQYGLYGVTTHGFRYETGLARSSGSAETSAFNSILNAFICYMGYRGTRVNGSFLEKDGAYMSLGIYGGDDGLSGGMSREGAKKSAESVGQKLDVGRITRGQPGVQYLARRYGPDVWFGDTNSCSDLPRQLSKFHLTVHLPSNITKIRKLQEKSFSFQLTDRYTPVLGEFVNKVLKSFPYAKTEFENLIDKWQVELDESKQYPNREAKWMKDYLAESLPEFDYSGFKAWLENTSGEALLNIPKFHPDVDPNPKAGKVVIDNDLVGSHPPETKSASPQTKAHKQFRPRKPKSERHSRTPHNTPPGKKK